MKFSNKANVRRHERNMHSIKHPTVVRPSPPQKKMKEVIPPIVYDYTKPELYREFLTDSKLDFIKRHAGFLEQLKNLRCTCCNHEFETYKTFINHIRKRNDTILRSLCFKCLKQFQSNALFVAHLKKKNCLNLYEVYCADDTIPKEPLPPIRVVTGTKGIIANKEYGCRLCPKTFRLKMDFCDHVYKTHGRVKRKETIEPECDFCKNVFETTSIRRRHYYSMECMAFLICGTCDQKFDNLAAYTEHVHDDHLEQDRDGAMPPDSMTSPDESFIQEDSTSQSVQSNRSVLKSAQNCKVCDKEYNNYYNVLRHMESKHPDKLPDIHRCKRCNIGYPRQTELREHMQKIHGVTMPKIKHPPTNTPFDRQRKNKKLRRHSRK